MNKSYEKNVFDKDKKDDKYYNMHEHSEDLQKVVPNSWMVIF